MKHKKTKKRHSPVLALAILCSWLAVCSIASFHCDGREHPHYFFIHLGL